ncbi:MAG: hypothetical protein AAF493_15555 [Pseudomonadota bacterium]
MRERLSERDREWLGHLEAANGMSLSQYASEHGLSVDVLYSAKSRLKRKGLLSASTSSRFTAVVAGEPRLLACRIVLRNGTVVEVTGELGDCVRLLEAASRFE